jgi:KaiC/GvpD/RAD55 family RecA-like ATPase
VYSPASIYSQDIVAVNVTVKNEGDAWESFGVTSYYDDEQIGHQAITNLLPNESAVVVFYWNTTGIMPGSYELRAVADAVLNEDDVADNIFTCGLVRIRGLPIASFVYAPEFPSTGETVTLNASLSVSEGGFITSFDWDFGDGNLTTASSSIMTHAYANVGNYTVVLNVTNDDGLWSIDSRTVSVGSQPVAPSSPWNWTWSLLCIPFLFLLFAGVGLKRRKSKPKHVGIEFLNRITGGGIPDSYSAMLVGGSDSGKTLLFQELLYEYLKNGKSCIYVAYEGFPDETRDSMKKFQWNTSAYESQGKLSFVDCFSSNAKVHSKEKYFLTQPFSLIDLGIVISKATNEAGNGVKIFLDSTTPLLTQLDPARVVDFLQDRTARVKGANGNLVFTSNRECMDPAMMSRLEEIVDCIIELDASQVKGVAVRRLRVKKMRGRNFSDSWVQFEIKPEKGIGFLI